MTKTSTTHPLLIDTLPLPEGGGAIGLTYCPGKCDLAAASGPWLRDLVADLGAVRAWGAHALVTLLEEHEFDLLHVRLLGDLAESAGLEWHHLPIPDMGVPGWQFERRWLYSGLRLRRLLRRGGRVVVHCRAGLGRTGTIAARLLVELGVPAAEAVSQVRRARPGTIQTGEQEAHVYTAHPIAAQHDQTSGRRLACLLGGALGDSYASAGPQRAALAHRTVPQSLGAPRLASGALHVSGATQLTLFTLEGLTRGLLEATRDDAGLVEQMRLSCLDWLETQGRRPGAGAHATRLLKHAALHARRAPGETCLEALEQGGHGSPEQPINDRQGSGAIMRVAPVALMPGMAPERAFRLAARAAALTHGAPEGYLPAGILAATLRALLDELPLQSALLQAGQLAQAWPGHETTSTRLRQALEAAILPQGGVLTPDLGSGQHAGEALAIGIYAASRSQDFREMVAGAVAHAGAGPTSTSIAGQLFGARQGIEALPNDWVRRLDVLDALCDLADWCLPLWRDAAG